MRLPELGPQFEEETIILKKSQAGSKCVQMRNIDKFHFWHMVYFVCLRSSEEYKVYKYSFRH